jgi:hypothetical protein
MKAILINDATQVIVQQSYTRPAAEQIPVADHTWEDTNAECAPSMIKVGEGDFVFPPQPTVYPTLSREQFMWIIYSNDFEADIQTLLNGLGPASKAKAKAFLMDGIYYERDDQYVTALINHLGHTDAQWDTWWLLAKDE